MLKEIIRDGLVYDLKSVTIVEIMGPVSYTHLDVYKRQGYSFGDRTDAG